MPFTEDLDQFFAEGDFASRARFQRGLALVKETSVIFDLPANELALYEQGVSEPTPRLRAKTADLATVKRGDVVEVEDAGWFRVERFEPDGTGVSTVHLAKAAAPAAI